MKFNTGDKVSFINEKQDGIVVKILSNNNVLVSIEDGFDIEVSEKELIKTGVVNLNETAPEKPAAAVKIDDEISDILSLAPAGAVCVAAIPGSFGAVLTGPIQFYLINNCDHQVLFTFYSKIKNNWEGVNHGVLQPGENKLIFKNKREELIDISLMQVQGLLFSPHQLQGTGYFKKEFGVVLPDLQNS
ncbi:MAG TPA: DUF2027 domain-containing protein, partial [Bacteroidia bacterium]|nr:DUF2027 domain-containing protein [Bacteroidia bacterium]